MKAKYLWVLLATAIFIGCDDNTGNMGLEMLPGDDMLEVKSKKYPIQTQSLLFDSVYAKTTTGYLGKFSDPDPDGFGYYEASFMAQFNCTEDFKFPEVYDGKAETGVWMAGDSIVDVFFVYQYGMKRYFGDSINACRMSIYELTENLDKKFYTSVDPTEFYDETKPPLARKAYTAVDQSQSLTYRRDTLKWTNSIGIDMPKEFGTRIYRLNRDHPEYFKDANSFIENVFKGIYTKCDYGDGTILYIDRVALGISFMRYATDSELKIVQKTDGTDSLWVGTTYFTSTKEVIQSNKVVNSDQLKTKAEDPTCTYIKSPAGLYTQATLPIQDIYDELHKDTLNSVKLSFTGYVQESQVDNIYAMQAPQTILLLREKDMYTFFESNSLTDGQTSFLITYSENQYAFTNITNLIEYCFAEKEALMNGEGKNWTAEEWEKWEKETKWNSVVLVPVITNYDSNKNLMSIQNDMKPGYVKLKGGKDMNNSDEPLEITVEYTQFY
ncbi:DUF4270 domain-containing protein [Bacteroides sp. 519]|uniref:DUF4270 domain-containing protein n=1 Tax=Bacteroides sp. 519 TaxID=2302937 RepID=UPI0013D44B9E|nr:DUF4270 domain-containing protein [Bacteroides sp. 519]NDV60125.1 DUF4270 domain-containing protein [Bacteroides sp. 519]